ncbi:MAG: carboxypeptidase-like regulatory domain-containing protein [Bacteroidota bacterium]
MKHLLLTCLFVLTAVSTTFAQAIKVHGTVTEAETGEPVPYANLRVQGYPSGALTDGNGDYELTVPGPGAIIEVSHLSFKKRFIKVRKRSHHRIDIPLSPEAIRIDDVVISDGLQRVLEDKTIHLYDYEFFQDQLFMIIYDRETRESKLALINEKDSIIDTYAGPETPGALVKDCLGNVHALTKHHACQLWAIDGKIEMFVDSIELFQQVVEPCLGHVEEYYYYRYDLANGQAVDYFHFNAEDGKATSFLQLTDNEKIHQMLDPLGPYVAFASTKEQMLMLPQETWDKINKLNHEMQFDRMAFFYPIHAPLHVVGDDIMVFDHTNDKILTLEKDGTETKSIDLSYDKMPNWEKTILIDEYREEAYTLSIKHGFGTLHEIDLETGGIKDSWELPRQFPKKIQIRNGVAYFMYKELNYDTTNRLYRLRLKD